MALPITALYAGVLAIFALVLSARAGGFRGKSGISVLYGDPKNMELAERVRVHQNFLEYIPMAIIIMGLIEANGGGSTFVHSMGIVLIISRIAHAVGLKHDNMAHPGRTIGAGGTALMTLVAAVYLLWMVVKPMFAS
ncbi:MAG: MAPEG family protein [Thermodesulfobacteriota bacterium]